MTSILYIHGMNSSPASLKAPESSASAVGSHWRMAFAETSHGGGMASDMPLPVVTELAGGVASDMWSLSDAQAAASEHTSAASE